MAVLDATNRSRVLFALLRGLAWAGFIKGDIKATVDAVDDWAEANAASFNAALPQPFRGGASASQKALILAYVCMRRAGILKVDEDNP